MYELQYTQQIVDAIIHELPKHLDRKPKSVKVLVGEKYQLDTQEVQKHYAEITTGTILEGVILDLFEELTEVLCNACGSRGPIRVRDQMICSACKSQNVKSIAGEVVNVQAIDF